MRDVCKVGNYHFRYGNSDVGICRSELSSHTLYHTLYSVFLLTVILMLVLAVLNSRLMPSVMHFTACLVAA